MKQKVDAKIAIYVQIQGKTLIFKAIDIRESLLDIRIDGLSSASIGAQPRWATFWSLLCTLTPTDVTRVHGPLHKPRF